MAREIRAGLTKSEGRSFGLAVGSAFLALAIVLWWRGRSVPAVSVAAIGALLMLAGVSIPDRLGPVHRAWMGLAGAISKVTTPVFMSLVYFLVITPTGIVRRVVSRSPLERPDADTYWIDHEPARPDSLKQQF